MNSKYFCVLPWYSKEYFYNRTTVCCLLPFDYDIDTIRKDLLQGRASPACHKCWTLEDNGQQSRRQQENLFLDYKLDRDIEKIEIDCQQNLHQEILYQINLGNLCNQACVTCNDSYSSKWAELKRQQGLPASTTCKVNLDEMQIDYANAKRMNILGGEPLFDPQLEILLTRLLEQGNKHCFVSFVTNGSIPLSSKLIDLISAFTDINICVSIDGIERRFEYMRWPGKWHTLVSNLEQYRKVTNNNVSVSYTISAVNAIYYDETVAWFASQQLNYNHNIVYTPNWASLRMMPLSIKKHLEQHSFFKPLLTQALAHQSEQAFINNLKQQDKMKKICFKDFLPDLANLLHCN